MRSYRYRWGEGLWSHLFHRISGVALIVYLSMHIWVIHHLQHGQTAYDELMNFLGNPLFRMGEVMLLAAILFHGLNGLRLVVMDAGLGIRKQRATFWVVFVVCAILVLVGGLVLLIGS
ncbi:MAG: succinate dehydrogenase, cytochrome b556 subunit [Candidatus Aureabacteria bacterium]|nr:succinate dehydrogenase, cytochrome b556 subunit [Candidatus Auribacterota bacterium]